MERRYGSLHRQTGRQGNDSFFALTHAWLNLHFFSLSLSLSLFSLAGWLVDDVAQFFKHCTARERENFVPYQFRCADKQREEERSNFNILIDIYFLPFYFFFFFFSPHFYAATLDFCCIKRRSDRLLRPWRHLPAQQQHLSWLLLPCISVVVVGSSVPAASLHPIGCVNKDWQGTQQTTSCKYPRHTHTRERESLGFLETLKPISLIESGDEKGVE